MVPFGTDDPRGLLVNPSCLADECVDLFQEVLTEAGRRLARQQKSTLNDPARYTSRLIKSVLTDLQRSARTAKGFPARPGRADGSAAIVIAQLQQSAVDKDTGAWHVALFRILRDYVHSPTRTGSGWPVDGLVRERIQYFPATADRPSGDVILADIEHVLSTAGRLLGTQWVHQHIWHPLLVGIRTEEVPEELMAPGGDLEDQVLSSWMSSEYAIARRAGLGPKLAYRKVAEMLSGGPAPELDDTLLRALREMEADTQHQIATALP